jgi:hypothetical protein
VIHGVPCAVAVPPDREAAGLQTCTPRHQSTVRQQRRRRVKGARICAVEGCYTQLARDNGGDICSAHAAKRGTTPEHGPKVLAAVRRELYLERERYDAWQEASRLLVSDLEEPKPPLPPCDHYGGMYVEAGGGQIVHCWKCGDPVGTVREVTAPLIARAKALGMTTRWKWTEVAFHALVRYGGVPETLLMLGEMAARARATRPKLRLVAGGRPRITDSGNSGAQERLAA